MTAQANVEFSRLARWLQGVIVDLAPRIHDTDGWSRVLGVSVVTIEDWLTDHQIPEARDLDAIVFILSENYAEVSAERLTEYAAMADLPIQKVFSPKAMLPERCFVKASRAQTLNQYRLTAMFENLWMAIGPLPADRQREVIQETIVKCNELVLNGA